jgi:hypothetical protein
MFQGSIRQNVLLGVSETTPDEILHKACRDAEIHDFIVSLPDGYNTDVGTKGFVDPSLYFCSMSKFLPILLKQYTNTRVLQRRSD